MPKENIIQDKSYHFALEIVKFFHQLSQCTESFVIGKQILRSGTSIGANIEEAIAVHTKDDFIYKMTISLKEACEVHYWLRIVRDSHIFLIDVFCLLDQAEE